MEVHMNKRVYSCYSYTDACEEWRFDFSPQRRGDAEERRENTNWSVVRYGVSNCFCRDWYMRKITEALNQLTGMVLDAAIAVHKEMGPGLLESVYQFCLLKELRARGINVQTTVPCALHYKGESLNKDYVIDLLIEDEIVVELKAVEGILPVYEAQY